MYHKKIAAYLVMFSVAVFFMTATLESAWGKTTPVKYTITVAQSTGGKITPAVKAQVAQGRKAAFTIKPSTGYHVTDIVTNDSSVLDAATVSGKTYKYVFNNVSADNSISATFEKDTYELTVSINGPGSVSAAGLTCGDNATCTGTYNYGDPVTLTAEPDWGFSVKSWAGCKTGATDKTSCKITVAKDSTVTAKFKAATDRKGGPNVSATEKLLLDSGNRFGFKLFKEIVKSESDKNIFISPLSVSMALGMTYNGADGTTQQEMQTTLELNGLTLQQANESYRSLTTLLSSLDSKVKFTLANSIWYRQSFPVEDEFISLNRDYFNAQVTALDFGDSVAPDTINAWVNNKTKGKIPTIVDSPIDAQTVMFLINAIYFKGDWALKFKEESTKDDLFTLTDGTQKTTGMMHQYEDFKYFEDADFQAVDLPYGNGDFSMTVLLPQQGKDVNSLIAGLNQENWDLWTKQLFTDEVDLYIPKFKLAYEKSLNDILIALGMGTAFDPLQADFTKMYKGGGIVISEVKHKTFVEVNEEGTEAAAVTSVEFEYASAPLPKLMKVNRPFLFVIRENSSGTILFIGKIMDPS